MSDPNTQDPATPAYRRFGLDDAARLIRAPRASDDKYSRGVIGVMTGSERYPGAAVLGVEAAVRTGVGMVRYLGDERPSAFVLQRRPEVVTSAGRVQAWLLGSGTSADDRTDAHALALDDALRSGVPLVVDAGALDLVGRASGPVLATPHYRELAGMFARDGDAAVTAAVIAADPARWAAEASERWGIAVLLKGSSTYVAGGGERLVVTGSTPWLATAGSGDVLGGALGAIVAGRAALAEEAGHPLSLGELAAAGAAGAVLHARAGSATSRGGPLAALDVADELSDVIRRALH